MSPSRRKKKTTSAKGVRQISQSTIKAHRQNSWIGVGLVLLVAFAVFVALSLNHGKIPLEITVAQAYQKYQEGAFLLDVRTPEEWNEFHVPNTTLIPLDQLPSRLNEVQRDKEIVVVCRSGNRSRSGREILLNAGFPRVTSMAGGLKQWQSAGYPVVSGP